MTFCAQKFEDLEVHLNTIPEKILGENVSGCRVHAYVACGIMKSVCPNVWTPRTKIHQPAIKVFTVVTSEFWYLVSNLFFVICRFLAKSL